jgi:hypothetical protein
VRPIAVVVLVLLTMSACFGKKARTASVQAASTSVPFATNFTASEFGPNSTTIDNKWFPLKPGTQFIWQGHALDGEELIDRKLVFTVTDLTKDIGGVHTLVGWDRDFNNGVLAESELIFLAQDKAGNVRHFGQYVELYDEEKHLEGTTGWIAGYLEGAKTGILMQADPTVGTPTYSEGFAPAPYYWDDVAKVIKAGQKTCVRAGCYSNVLVIQESEPTKPDAFQLKYYAPGIGNVRTGWAGEAEEEQETLELIKIVQLTPAQLAQVRADALAIESRAFVYGRTHPLRLPSPSPSPS